MKFVLYLTQTLTPHKIIVKELSLGRVPLFLHMHALPVERNRVVMDEVVDSPMSIIYDQAENRLHAQKAIMALVMG